MLNFHLSILHSFPFCPVAAGSAGGQYTLRAADVRMEGGTITDYTGTHKSIRIPERINGVAVTSIGDYAFYNNPDLSSIALPAPADPNKIWRDNRGNYYEPGSAITDFYTPYFLTDRT